MNRLNYSYFALLAAMLATLFLFGGCLPDKEKAEARRQERLLREVFAIQEELILTGDTATAIAKLEKLNDKHPDHLEVIDALGSAYKEKGDLLMTAFFYDYAFELAPENPDFALQAARAHEANGSGAEALVAYRAYLKLNPAANGLWRNIALLEMEQGNHQLALSAYLEALRADKVQPTAEDKLGIAILYHKLGNQPQAQRWYEDLLAERELEQQVRVDGMTGLFDLALRQKQWEQALELMHGIERLAPGALQGGDYASAYAELTEWDNRRKQAEAEAVARAQAEQEKAAAAKAKAEKQATEQSAATGSATEATGKDAVVATDKDAAETTDKDVVAATDKDAAEAAAKDAAVGKDEAAKDAAKAVDSASEVKQETESAKDAAKITGESAKGAAKATGESAKGAAKATGEATADVTKATVESVTAEDAEAAAAAATAAELAKRGKSAFEAEDFTVAAELLERSAKLNPNNGEVLDMLSRASFRTGLFPQAERYAMLATYAEPQNVNYRLEYLRAYQRNHPPASMLQQLISAREAFPKDPNVALALARGYEYIAQRKALAAGLYHEYLQMAPDSPLADDIRQKLLEWEM